MSRYRCKHYWNYRVVTKIIPGTTGHDLVNGTVTQFPDERVFSITEVYYKRNKPDSYVDSANIMANHESVKDLKWIRKKMKKAFKKPILDLDNWPQKFHKNG